MYVAARNWGIQPGEFWEMTMSEWLLEAHMHWLESDEGKLHIKRRQWMEDAELSKEEWMAKYGLA